MFLVFVVSIRPSLPPGRIHAAQPSAIAGPDFCFLPGRVHEIVHANVTNEAIILVADDDDGHARLIEKNLVRAGLRNPIQRFEDGQQILDFLFRVGEGAKREASASYLLLLDIRMPKVDGVEVLRQVKADAELRKLPVIMLTTTEDPREVERCHLLGCNSYITKPVEYDKFSEAIKQIGVFLSFVKVPAVNGRS